MWTEPEVMSHVWVWSPCVKVGIAQSAERLPDPRALFSFLAGEKIIIRYFVWPYTVLLLLIFNTFALNEGEFYQTHALGSIF